MTDREKYLTRTVTTVAFKKYYLKLKFTNNETTVLANKMAKSKCMN